MKQFILGFVAGFCSLLALLVLLYCLTFIGKSPRLENGIDRLQFGMTRGEVVAVMGDGYEQSTDVPLGLGSMEHAVATRIEAKYFLSWRFDDFVYLVAFGDGDRVIYKARCHS